MPKLPAVKPREIVKFLQSNGFVLDHVPGSHHIYYNPTSKRRAVVPQHNREIPKGTLVSLLREAGFTLRSISRIPSRIKNRPALNPALNLTEGLVSPYN